MAAFYFKFIPGDYLRDTQNLSEKAQVAYDRIMCEMMRETENHMKIICISYAQHKFFTKRLNDDEKEELALVLRDTGTGFCIPWVAASIDKSRAYSESRSKNKKGKKKENPENHMISYDNHMDSNYYSNNTKKEEKENKEGLREKKEKKEETTKVRKMHTDISAELNYPSEGWRAIWMDWAEYKRTEHRDSYKTVKTAQIALDNLIHLSGGDERQGQEIARHSMANHWKGFYKPKPEHQSNGNSSTLFGHTGQQPSGIPARRTEALKQWGTTVTGYSTAQDR